MKKKGLFSIALGLIMCCSFIFSACGFITPTPQVEVATQDVPLGRFEITKPVVNATNADVNPRVSWTKEVNAEKYRVSLSEDSTFEEICAEEETTRTYTAITETLKYATKYYLRIYAIKKNAEGNDVALSYRSTVFTTKESHEKPKFDGEATRTIHDFENFADDEEIDAFFETHTGGDSLKATIAEGEGVNGSNAMLLTYTRLGRGWSAVGSMNEPEKKNWNGATGVRFWIKVLEGGGGTFSIKIGKRGYQRWRAQVVLNSEEPCYVTIPFSDFVDVGGGDGVWNQEIVFLDFYYNGNSNAKILIDDFTIGSGELYSTDTRKDMEDPKKAIVVDTPFETFDKESSASLWKIENHNETNKDLIKSYKVPNSGNAGLQVYDGTSFGTNSYTLTASGYDFEKADLSNVNGFRMDVQTIAFNDTADVSGAVGRITVTIGSEGNYYYMTKDVYNKKLHDNQLPAIVCDFAGMKLADGSTGELDRSKIDTVKIKVEGLYSGTGAHQFRIDNMEFYTAKVGAKDSFEPAKWYTGAWNSVTNFDATTGVASNSATGNGTAIGLQLQDTSYTNMQKTYGVRFKVKATNVANLRVRITLNYSSNGYKMDLGELVNGEQEIVLYYNQMTLMGSLVNTKWYYYLFDVTYKTGEQGSIEIYDFELLVG